MKLDMDKLSNATGIATIIASIGTYFGIANSEKMQALQKASEIAVNSGVSHVINSCNNVQEAVTDAITNNVLPLMNSSPEALAYTLTLTQSANVVFDAFKGAGQTIMEAVASFLPNTPVESAFGVALIGATISTAFALKHKQAEKDLEK